MGHHDEPGQLPDPWKESVARILRENRRGTVFITSRARNDWESTFPDTFEYERNEAIIRTLKMPEIRGRQIYDMKEAGEVWQFWIHYRNRRIFTKINLLSDKTAIILYSSHIPLKGDTL